jgi:uncharacterized repeat protein (TIGR01451 family)
MKTRRNESRRRNRTGARAPRVEVLERRELLATFTVTNTGDLNPNNTVVAGSLRDAILSANASPGADVIRFNIGGSGVKTISLNAALPSITDVLTIDGTTQTGYVDRPLIELNGTNAGANANGLLLSSPTQVKALTINRFGGFGIRITTSGSAVQSSFIGTTPDGLQAAPNASGGILIDTASNTQIGGGTGLGNLISGNGFDGIEIRGNSSQGNRIYGNLVGTDISGNRALPNTFDGLFISGGGFNVIGGTEAGQRNIFSGNGFRGIHLFVSNSNTIQNNYVGTTMNGSSALPNTFAGGVVIQSGTNNQIGGPLPEQRNLISGNSGDGVNLIGANRTVIQNNHIGTDVSGQLSIGNLGYGITSSGNDNLIGGLTPGVANIVAFNGGTISQDGIRISGGTGNSIFSNSIHSNRGLGIALTGSGNNGQVPPSLTVASTGVGRTLIQGTLAGSLRNSQYRLQFFSNNVPDPSGFGEGRTLIGEATVTTDDQGTAAINLTLQNPVQVDQYITATATDPNGNTSSFSAALRVEPGAISDLNLTLDATPTIATLNNPLAYTITVTNNGPDPATNVVVTNTLPSSVILDPAFNPAVETSPGGTFQINGSVVTARFPSLAPNASATVVIHVLPTAVGNITNTATVTSTDIDPDVQNNTSSLSTTVSVPADMEVNATALTFPATVGQELVYLVSVRNNGPGTATGVELTVNLPIDVNIIDASAGQGQVQFIGNTIRVLVGTLPADTPSALRIVVQPEVSGTTSLTATVRANEVQPPGPDPTPNSVTIVTPVLPASDLIARMTASPTPAVAPGLITYVIEVENVGPNAATNVMVNNPLPSMLAQVTAETDTGTVEIAGGEVRASIGTLPFGAKAFVTIRGVPVGSGLVTNTATVRSSESDPNPMDNVASATVLFNPVDMVAGLSVNSSLVLPSQQVIVTATASNFGPADATNVEIAVAIPAGLMFVSADGGVTPGLDGVVRFNAGNLVVGQTASRQLVLQPTASARSQIVSTVSASEVELDGANNTAFVDVLANPVNLVVGLDAPTGPVLVGDPVTIVAVVTNAGPGVASQVFATVPLPANASLVETRALFGVLALVPTEDGRLVAAIENLPAGATAAFTFTLRPIVEGTLPVSLSAQAAEVEINPSDNTRTVAVQVVNLAGTVGFTSPTYSVSEKDGQAVITVVRSGGTKGELVVTYAAAAGQGAVPGVNFTPVAGTLALADGQREASFVVPILRDNTTTAVMQVQLALMPVTPDSVGPNGYAILNILEADFSPTGPQVADTAILAGANGMVLSFNEPLDPATASNPANYRVSGPGGGTIPVVSATYDPTARTVVLVFGATLPANSFQTLTATGLVGLSGVPIDGAGNGVPGSPLVVSFARGTNLSFLDRDGDTASLRLTGPGAIDVFRSIDGTTQRVRVVNGNASSILSGSVRRVRGGDGRVSLGLLENVGLGFGQAQSRLRTPPFTALNSPAVSTPPRRPIVAAATPSSLLARRLWRR